MSKSRTLSFVAELPLVVMPPEERQLLVRLDVARQVYNACLGESLKRLQLMQQSNGYQAACRLPRTNKGTPQARERPRSFWQASVAVAFRGYDLHAYAAQFHRAWLGEPLDISTIQKLATRAFKAVQQHSFGRRGRPRFKGPTSWIRSKATQMPRASAGGMEVLNGSGSVCPQFDLLWMANAVGGWDTQESVERIRAPENRAAHTRERNRAVPRLCRLSCRKGGLV